MRNDTLKYSIVTMYVCRRPTVSEIFSAEMDMGWVHQWVGLGRVGSDFLAYSALGWVG